MLPKFSLAEHDGIIVVRDDRLPGGTKRRVLPCLIKDQKQEYVYASPVYGYAQIALAHSAKHATIFCAERKTNHPRTLEAKAAGAKIVEVPCGYMSVVRARAKAYCAEHGAVLLPFGLDVPEFIDALAAEASKINYKPREVWTVAGSGVLSRALQAAWPKAKFFAVRVGAEPDAGRATVLQAPEKFENDAKMPPPFPSCSNYDAKAWRFVRASAKPGALFWNVAS